MRSDVPLLLNTLKLFEAAASLSGPLQVQRGKTSLPKPDLPVAQDEILIEFGDISPSGLTCHQTKARHLGDHSGEPKESESSLTHLGQRGLALRQPLWD